MVQVNLDSRFQFCLLESPIVKFLSVPPRTQRPSLLQMNPGENVARGICHSVDADLVIDTDRWPLGNDRVAILIAESLCEAKVSSLWMWSMRSWHITQ